MYQEEKERRVFKSSLCKAFGLQNEKITDVFDSEEGRKFMADELDLEGSHLLPRTATTVCELVGHQKFCLMIIGSMITKGNKSWDDVLSFVHSVRDEVGLTISKK